MQPLQTYKINQKIQGVNTGGMNRGGYGAAGSKKNIDNIQMRCHTFENSSKYRPVGPINCAPRQLESWWLIPVTAGR
jgi:hypothetical protein